MSTKKQRNGARGERLVARRCSCPKCKRNKTFRQLKNGFECADLICKFCGFLAQVKAAAVNDLTQIPNYVPSAAWRPMQERLAAGIYIPLFLVLFTKTRRPSSAIYYLSPDLQELKMFRIRNPSKVKERKNPFAGYGYDFSRLKDAFVRLDK